MFKHLTEKEWEDKLKVSGLALQWLENPTYEQCLMAIKQNGMALAHVPTEHQTMEIYIEAIKQNFRVFKRLLSWEKRQLFVKKLANHLDKLKEFGPNELKEFVLINPNLIEHFESATLQDWVVAIKKIPELMLKIPENALTPQFVRLYFGDDVFSQREKMCFYQRLKGLNSKKRLELFNEFLSFVESFEDFLEWELLFVGMEKKLQLELLKQGMISEPAIPLTKWTEEDCWTFLSNLPTNRLSQIPNAYYREPMVYQTEERRLGFSTVLVGSYMLPSEEIDQQLTQLLAKLTLYSKKNNSFSYPAWSFVRTFSQALQEEGLLLGQLANQEKNYRLCRLAIQQTDEAKWFSPYHALELLEKEVK